MDGGTAVQIGDIKDFWKIAKEEEIFFWHFIQEKQCDAAVKIKPLTNLDGNICFSELAEIVDTFKIKVFESYSKDATEFLVELGYHGTQIYNPKCGCFGPKFIGFKKGKLTVGTAVSNICYCTEGIVEIIYLTNPSLFK